MGKGLRTRRRRRCAVEQLESRVLLADLFGAFFDAPAAAAPGSTIDVTYQIDNGGPGDTPDFHVNFYLSANATISGTDTLLGSADLSVAGNASTGHLLKSLTLPASGDAFWQSVSGGTYHIGMTIDTNNTVAETNENNNANGGQGLDRDSLVLPPTMELFGSFFDAPATAGPGATFDVTYQINNSGTGATPEFHVNWYLSSDSTISSADILLAGGDLTLAAGANTTHLSKSVTLPGPSDPFWVGKTAFHIGMLIDTNTTVAEIDENNNGNRGQALDRDSLAMPMDLLGTFFDAPATAAPGSTIAVTYQISNSGAAATPDFHVEWYLSKNSTISSSDLLLTGTDLNLPGANTGHLSKSLTLPGPADPFWQGAVNGTYYLGMIIDTGSTTAETDENNNRNRGQALDWDSLTIDGTAPTAALVTVTPPTSGPTAGFLITYADNVAVKFSTVSSGDIRVTGPNGYSELATLLSTPPVADFSSSTFTYTIAAPDGGWDPTDNGIYTVSMVASEVSDTSGTFVAAGALGTFTVNISANPPTIDSLSDTPDPVTRPSSLTLTATSVTGGASSISVVEFYRDSNNNGLLDSVDTLLGTDNDPTGGWSAAHSTLGFSLATNRYFARAQNTDGFWSAVATTTGTVNNGNPTIESLSATSSVARGSNVTLTANNVSDAEADGTVVKVEFYRDSNGNGQLDPATDTLLGSDTSSTGGWSLIASTTGFSLGLNTYFARAQDNDGGTSTAVTITGTVTNGIPVIGSLSATPDPIARGTTLTLTANSVSDPDGTIVKVEFYRDINNNGVVDLDENGVLVPGTDILLGTDASATGGWTLSGPTTGFPLGVNRFLARALDNNNPAAWSAIATTTVVVENALPAIGSLLPTPEPAIRKQNLTLTAKNVTDRDGSVVKVEFYRDSNDNGILDIGGDTPDALLGPVTSPSLSGDWTWTGSTADFPLGTNRYFARAQDNETEGAWSAAATITGSVNNALPVIGSLTDAPDPLIPEKDLILTANNVSDEISVAKVEFYRDLDKDGVIDDTDLLLGTDDSADGGWNLTVSTATLQLGTYNYLARAQDSDGAWSALKGTTSTIARPGAVSGIVFNDLNGNGRKDSGEAALSNWRIYIDQDRDGVFDSGEQTVFTDKRGRWTLHPAQFGTNRIRAVLKRGWKFTAPKNGVLIVRLDNAQPATGKLFGVKRI